MMTRSKTYISFNKKAMEYNNATLEGQSKFLITELIKKTIKNYLRSQLDVYNKKIITKLNSHEIKPKQNSLTCTSLEKIWDQFSMPLVNRSTESEKK